jgi:hypothetical protein
MALTSPEYKGEVDRGRELVQADDGVDLVNCMWEKTLPHTTDYPKAKRLDDGSNSAGMECLQTDFCRSLAGVQVCPPALQYALL